MDYVKSCDHCEASFTVSSKNKAKRFCGKLCYYAHQRTIRGSAHPNFGRPRSEEMRARLIEWSRNRVPKRGSQNGMWRGGRTRKSDGYILVRINQLPEHEQKWFAGMKFPYVPEHRLVMARKLGRALDQREHVHHINGIKGDNDENNLIILHEKVHTREHWMVLQELVRLRAENGDLRRQLALSKKIPVAGYVA